MFTITKNDEKLISLLDNYINKEIDFGTIVVLKNGNGNYGKIVSQEYNDFGEDVGRYIILEDNGNLLYEKRDGFEIIGKFPTIGNLIHFISYNFGLYHEDFNDVLEKKQDGKDISLVSFTFQRESEDDINNLGERDEVSQYVYEFHIDFELNKDKEDLYKLDDIEKENIITELEKINKLSEVEW